MNSVGLDDKLVKFLKQLYEAPEGVKTEELFTAILRKEPLDAENWVSLSSSIQGLLGLVCEGEPLQIVENTSVPAAQGQGFES